MITLTETPRWRRLAALAAALLLLDASLTFVNVWPTPIITWRGELSVELAVLVLIAAIAGPKFGARPRVIGIGTTVWMLLVLGRYADVTTSALFGREVNLYWDLRFVPDVIALFVRVAPWWGVLAVVAAAIGVLWLLASVIRWAVRCVLTEGAIAPARAPLGVVAAVLLATFFLQPVRDYETPLVPFASPITPVYVRQALVAATAVTGRSLVPASPPMATDLSRVRGADVFVIFLESYGSVTYDRPSFAAELSDSRAMLSAAIADTGRRVVSTAATSPTFGGSSWLAHISLLSGVEVRTPDTNAMLMAQKRDTLVTVFARHGYRTIALMPGLWQPWPEGAFYGFDRIYGGQALAYAGPSFGWFDIPDQYALGKLDRMEPARDGTRRFVFFPTISTHTPFHPTPPYQRDWERLLTEQPFDEEPLEQAFAGAPDWLNLGPDYVRAVAYAYDVLAGYLRENAGRDAVFVVLGDHQPPALVTGEGAPWDVPVHIISNRGDLLDRLQAEGFREGLGLPRPATWRIHELLPVLLRAFGDPPDHE